MVSRYIINQYFVVTYIFYSLKPTRIKVNIIIEVQMKKKREKVNDSTFDEII